MEIDASEETVTEFDTEAPIHNIIVEKEEDQDGEDDGDDWVFILETPDNQLDYNNFNLEEVGTDDFTFTLDQKFERVRRKNNAIDPIVKTCFYSTHDHSYALALRESGLTDIYCDG